METPNRVEVEALKGSVMLEFGASWCGYCQAAHPIIDDALANYPNTRHIKIEDAKGCRLGRSYTVKLWPTLIFILNGTEVQRLVRPIDSDSINKALAKINL